MMVLSISGLFKTILLIIGAFVLLRFIGQLMIAKRNIDEEKKLNDLQDKIKKQKEFVERNTGKIKISKNSSSKDESSYVEYEEI